VLQDLLGHGVFIATLLVIGLLLLAPSSGVVPPWVMQTIIGLSLVQLVAWYALQLWLMRWYAERDRYDWALRLLFVPELLYSNFLTLALLGSYIFLGFNTAARLLTESGWGRTGDVLRAGFKALGYSGGWGTRNR
jgi:hypothetical protein